MAGAGAVGGRFLLERREVTELRGTIGLPGPTSPAKPVPRGAHVRVPGMPPFVTPNRGFYRIDTALTLPQVDPRDWTLRIHGMVGRPLEITFDELLSRALIERDITLSCVSNQVGGDLAGNARWLGDAPLASLPREAGVRRGADQLPSRGADGMTIGTALDPVLDGRDAMLAVAMNGEPLPVKHRFPARHGRPGPVRLRVGSSGGVQAVEWRVDDGPWRAAELAPVPSSDTWRQWAAAWDAAPGDHTLRVRATDGTGTTQPSERTPPLPDGATGWHSVVVTVT